MRQNQITNLYNFWTRGANWYIEIPKFQRPYEWKIKTIEILFNDIDALELSANPIIKQFCGSMYIKLRNDNQGNDNFDVLQIVDGQQRLLTIFIMLIVIKNEYPNVFKSNGLSIFNPCGNSNRIRLQTRVGNDQEIINQLSNNTNISKIKKSYPIYKCYDFFCKKFKSKTESLSSEDKLNYFNSFFKKMSNFEIAINVLDDNNDMFQIFHSINAKCQNLTLRDILHNYILNFSENKNNQIENIWSNVLNNYDKSLGEDYKFTYLLRYFFQYKFDDDIKINDLLNKFVDKYNNGNLVFNFVTEFDEFINYIIDFKNSDKYAILLKDKKIIIGQLFYCHKKFPNIYDYFKKIMFSYLVRRNICELDSKGVTAIIPKIIPSITHVDKSITSITEIKIKNYFRALKGNSEFPRDDKLKENIINNNFYAKKNICKPILLLIEKYCYSRNNININNLNDVSVDHVNPVSKQNNLGDNLPDDKKYKLNNSMGNLTLLPSSINESLRNVSFNIKKERYLFGSQYAMNNYFRDINSWNVVEIKKRSELMFEFIKELFPSVF